MHTYLVEGAELLEHLLVRQVLQLLHRVAHRLSSLSLVVLIDVYVIG